MGSSSLCHTAMRCYESVLEPDSRLCWGQTLARQTSKNRGRSGAEPGQGAQLDRISRRRMNILVCRQEIDRAIIKGEQEGEDGESCPLGGLVGGSRREFGDDVGFWVFAFWRQDRQSARERRAGQALVGRAIWVSAHLVRWGEEGRLLGAGACWLSRLWVASFQLRPAAACVALGQRCSVICATVANFAFSGRFQRAGQGFRGEHGARPRFAGD